MFPKQRRKNVSKFSEVLVRLASPNAILEQSHGKITESDTLNHRTYKPEKDGLFCEAIFGPEEDWKCACGKYKGIKYKGNVCDRCGVEINRKKVRRERMAHIELVIPVVHPWYFRYLPNKIATLLDIPSKKLESLVYYSNYIVVKPGVKAKDGLEKMTFLSRREYYDVLEKLPQGNSILADSDPNKVIISTGGEALEMLLKEIKLDELSRELRHQIRSETSQQRRAQAIKRLEIVEGFRSAEKKGVENKPEWMVLRYLPVIPPGMRPSARLPNGRIATSDITERYRRIIICNNRLQKLIDIKAPDVIKANEKRMLQERVNDLYDEPPRSSSSLDSRRVPNSLSTNLKGKSGTFRRYLLGKRVDFSGRSVIVVGPELALHECGLPKDMAVKLFRPFIISGLINRGIVNTPKEARKIIEKKTPLVFEILKNKIKTHPVLLNRPPTLHRLSIQAFMPRLVEGKAIRLHPLVCTAFNADFDGDQMGVYIPLSQEAISEAFVLMLSSNNILNPANGQPITIPSKDMVLGLYYLTNAKKPELDSAGQPYKPFFSSIQEVILAYENKSVSRHQPIILQIVEKGTGKSATQKRIETTVGRAILNQYIPDEIGYVNELLDSKKTRTLVGKVYHKTGITRTAQFLDDIKKIGFRSAYEGGISFNISDIKTPKEKKVLLGEAQKELDTIWDNYYAGLITSKERYNQAIDLWSQLNTKLTSLLIRELSTDRDGFNPVYMMFNSGARGSKDQLGQMGAMKGLLASSSQGIIEEPILNSFIEGIPVSDYFRSGSGTRKGFADTASKTADAGHLTRRLAYAGQGVTITERDCGTLLSKKVTPSYNSEGDVKLSIKEQALGRIAAQDIVLPNAKTPLLKAGEEITDEVADQIDQSGLESIQIRSVLHCRAKDGICVQCYGRDLGRGGIVQVGESVGIVAAQSIAEPGTQLTLNTFHSGGVAITDVDEGRVKANVQGIIRLANLETVTKSGDESGHIVISRASELQIIDPKTNQEVVTHIIPYAATLFVSEGQKVSKGDVLFEWDSYNVVIISHIGGKVNFSAMEKGVTYKEEKDDQTGRKKKIIIDSRDKSKVPNLTIEGKNNVRIAYTIPINAYLSVDQGDTISAGDILAKIPRNKGGLKDITGGLPFVNKLFEARQPFRPVPVSAVDGVVSYGVQRRGNQQIIVTAKDGSQHSYDVSMSNVIIAQEGDYVKACAPLADGEMALNSILDVKGLDELFNYMIGEIQNIYRGQGVKIDDKHIEVILRQMTQKVKIVEPGDTSLIPDALVHRSDFRTANKEIKGKKIILDSGDSSYKAHQLLYPIALQNENERLQKEGLQLIKARDAQPAIGAHALQGITRACTTSKSFIAAAAFQETIKVLSKAVINTAVDELKGLHENIIVGNPIPAGTGRKEYDDLRVVSKDTYDTLIAEEQQA